MDCISHSPTYGGILLVFAMFVGLGIGLGLMLLILACADEVREWIHSYAHRRDR